ncbi:hypothetical protein LZG75_12105 [Polynucleobacter sp. IMCC30063]|uniref:hypothetical protein n=1 Tax=Polynucleobacter sp. IMCC30063 TaxID=2907298 RepID=UPI001F30021B|nr:hypothetical protein [Polynucleobacter sp. IMCC30063]MCE7506972.1 hypothetical protein [Polynucleobacter sp. IMCC30063]
MKKAVERFLKERKDCQLVEVTLKNYKGGKFGDCWQNTLKYIERDKSRYSEICGWLVGEDYGKSGTIFIAHFWVFDKLKNIHIDITPRAEQDNQTYEYISDSTVIIEMRNIYRKTERFSFPPPILLMGDDNFYVCDIAVGATNTEHRILNKIKTANIEVANLFALVT